MKTRSILFGIVFVFAIVMLSGCQILVDPSGHHEVDIDTEEAEEAVSPWIPKGEVGECGVSNCHGPVECGEPVEACTMQYELGDFCREYATCEASSKGCGLVPTNRYQVCRTCIESCHKNESTLEAFDCEAQCRAQLEK